MKTLRIKLTSDNSDCCLNGFPLVEGQYISGGENTPDYDVAEIYLGDRDDTTAAQEQFLDSLECCISYDVTESINHNSETQCPDCAPVMATPGSLWLVRDAGGVLLAVRRSRADANRTASNLESDFPGREISVKEVHHDDVSPSEVADVDQMLAGSDEYGLVD